MPGSEGDVPRQPALPDGDRPEGDDAEATQPVAASEEDEATQETTQPVLGDEAADTTQQAPAGADDQAGGEDATQRLEPVGNRSRAAKPAAREGKG